MKIFLGKVHGWLWLDIKVTLQHRPTDIKNLNIKTKTCLN
jgi:hypothetical protein